LKRPWPGIRNKKPDDLALRRPVCFQYIGGIIIKNHNKILLVILAIIAGIPLLVSIALMLPGIQTRIVEKLTARLSKDLNTEISIERVQALPFAGITLNNFLIRDLKKDTLLFAPKVHSEIDYFSILKKHF
jgi:hypothetical protein